MNLYEAVIPPLTKGLANIDRWFDKLAAHAAQKKFDPAVVLTARLAPDQYSFTRQVQSACDQAKFTAAKLCGKEPPAHPDTETTVDELRARIKTVIGYLETFKREDFEGAEERACGHVWMGGKTMRGGDYLDHFALPNFYFHMTHAYAILRHNGLDLTKTDFVAPLPLK